MMVEIRERIQDQGRHAPKITGDTMYDLLRVVPGYPQRTRSFESLETVLDVLAGGDKFISFWEFPRLSRRSVNSFPRVQSARLST